MSDPVSTRDTLHALTVTDMIMIWLFMFETMKRKQSNSNVFNLLVDGCYFIVSGAQWPVCTLYIYNFTCVSFWKLSCNINGSGYVAEKDYPTVSYGFLSTV